MPLINNNPYFDLDPSESYTQEIPTEDQINNALQRAGILPEQDDVDNIRNILNKNGATAELAAQNIANVASRSDNDHSRLKASEIILDLHGFRDKEGKSIKQPIFNFVINSPSVNIQNVFNPSSSRNEK